MQLHYYFVHVKRYVQQGIRKKWSRLSMVTVWMPVLTLRWYMQYSERTFRSLRKRTVKRQL